MSVIKKYRRANAALDQNDGPEADLLADRIVSLVNDRLTRRFGITPQYPRQSIEWLRVLLQEEKLLVAQGHLRKGQTLRAALRKLAPIAKVLKLAAPEPELPDELETEDAMPTRLTEHVRVGNLRKGGSSVSRKSEKRALRQLGAADVMKRGLSPAAFKKKQLHQLGALAQAEAQLHPAAGRPVVLPDEQKEISRLHTIARDLSDPINASRARAELEKRADAALHKNLGTPGDSNTVAEAFGLFGFRPRE